jgi:microcystin-dependent protein
MADTVATNLSGQKIRETYKGVLHFDSALGSEIKPLYDGAGTKTALRLGTATDGAIIDGDLQVLSDLTISSNSNLIGDVTVGGDITLSNGGSINDLTINPSGDDISLRSLKNTEVGKLRIRESDTDYELIFGNPTQTTKNLFSIIVKKDNTNNLYIKNNYSDPDDAAPLWINRATGEVNIKSLKVNSFDNRGAGGGLYPTGGIMMFTVSGVPTGWLECDGRDLSISDYGVLHAVIGQNYKTNSGLDTNSRFQIPDMRGLFVRGWDNGKDIDAGRSLGTRQEDVFKSHTHSVNDPGHTHTIVDNGGYFADEDGVIDIGGYGDPPVPGAGATGLTYTVPSSPTGISIGAFGDPKETRPKNIALIYCIKT